MDKALHSGYKTTEHQKLQVLFPHNNGETCAWDNGSVS